MEGALGTLARSVAIATGTTLAVACASANIDGDLPPLPSTQPKPVTTYTPPRNDPPPASTVMSTTVDAGPKTCTACRGVCTAAGVCAPARSCKDAKTAAPTTAASGVYGLDPTGTGSATVSAYCDMTGDGGGWTLVIKADGAQPTFTYGSALWTNDDTLNPDQPNLDTIEAKLATFSTVAFTSVRMGLTEAGVTRWLVLPLTSPSMRAMFGSATRIDTNAGRDAWKATLATSSLQLNCNSEGVNNAPGINALLPRVRIGIIGNEQNDCMSPDSWIGIGGLGTVCGGASVPANIATTVGNTARMACGADNGDRTTRAFGVLMVR